MTHYFEVTAQFGSIIAHDGWRVPMACNEEMSLGPTVRVVCGCAEATPDGGSKSK